MNGWGVGLVFYNTSEVSWGSDIKQGTHTAAVPQIFTASAGVGSGALFMMIGVAFLMMVRTAAPAAQQ